jgi:hypothetical protein
MHLFPVAVFCPLAGPPVPSGQNVGHGAGYCPLDMGGAPSEPFPGMARPLVGCLAIVDRRSWPHNRPFTT